MKIKKCRKCGGNDWARIESVTVKSWLTPSQQWEEQDRSYRGTKYKCSQCDHTTETCPLVEE